MTIDIDELIGALERNHKALCREVPDIHGSHNAQELFPCICFECMRLEKAIDESQDVITTLKQLKSERDALRNIVKVATLLANHARNGINTVTPWLDDCERDIAKARKLIGSDTDES